MNKEKISAILSGWTNYVIKSPAIESMALERADKCSECPHMNPKGTVKKLMPDNTLIKTQGFVCGLCGCPLSTLLRQALKSCPNNPPKW